MTLFAGCARGADDFRSDRDLVRAARESAQAAGQWLTSNIRPDGFFPYQYDPVTGEYSKGNNAIRQLMASRSLAELSREKPEYRNLHRQNLDAVLRQWFRVDGDVGYIFHDGQAKLGAAAMALRALVASPFFAEYEGKAEELVRGILSVQEESGAFRPWIREPKVPRADGEYLLTFYSGEAILALLEYAQQSEDPRAIAAARRSQDFYVQRYVDRMGEFYYPAYVPWHTQSLHLLFMITGEEKYAKAAFAMNDKLLELLDTTEHVGRFFNPKTPQYGAPHASSDAVYTEGLVHAYDLARKQGDDTRATTYRTAIALAVGNLQKLQYTESDTSSTDRLSSRFLGALRIGVDRPHVRVDTTQHALDAFTAILRVFK